MHAVEGFDLPSAVTFSDPDFDLLKTSFKSVNSPCDELLAHLTRNFASGNKMPSEGFLANCRLAILTPIFFGH